MSGEGTELPEGWASVRLSDVVLPIANIKPEEEPSRVFRYVDISSIDNVRFTITETKEIRGEEAPSRARRPVQTGDILFSNVRTYLRNIAVVTQDVDADVCSTGFTVLRPREAVSPNYLFRYVLTNEFIDRVTPEQTGTHYPATSDRVVMSQTIRLPPFAEQVRIVDATERILERVSSARERLVGVPSILKRFRQAVLAAACSGKLTASWRLSHDAEPDVAGDLPSTWRTVKLADVIEGLKYGTSKKSDYSVNGVPVLRIPNIGDGAIRHDDIKYSSLETSEFEQLRLCPGDILMIRSNGSVTLLGKTALVREPERNFAYAGYLIRIRPNLSLIRPEYLNAVLASREVRDQIEVPARSTSGGNNINSNEGRSLAAAPATRGARRSSASRVDILRLC